MLFQDSQYDSLLDALIRLGNCHNFCLSPTAAVAVRSDHVCGRIAANPLSSARADGLLTREDTCQAFRALHTADGRIRRQSLAWVGRSLRLRGGRVSMEESAIVRIWATRRTTEQRDSDRFCGQTRSCRIFLVFVK